MMRDEPIDKPKKNASYEEHYTVPIAHGEAAASIALDGQTFDEGDKQQLVGVMMDIDIKQKPAAKPEGAGGSLCECGCPVNSEVHDMQFHGELQHDFKPYYDKHPQRGHCTPEAIASEPEYECDPATDQFEAWCEREIEVQESAGNKDRAVFLAVFVLPAYRMYRDCKSATHPSGGPDIIDLRPLSDCSVRDDEQQAVSKAIMERDIMHYKTLDELKEQTDKEKQQAVEKAMDDMVEPLARWLMDFSYAAVFTAEGKEGGQVPNWEVHEKEIQDDFREKAREAIKAARWPRAKEVK
jgi:hypothetical protein